MPDPTRAIRVGLIYDGTVIDERIVESPRPVSVGTELGATLSVDAPELPRQIALVDWHDGRYVLRAFPEMTGRLDVDGEIESLDDAGFGCETDGAGAALIPLQEVSAGRVAFGDAVVLLQRVSPSSKPSRPTLPDELTWSLRSDLDGRLAGTLAVAALLQIGLVAWAQLHDWPEPEETGIHPGAREFVSVDEMPPPSQNEPDPTPEPPTPETTPDESNDETDAPTETASAGTESNSSPSPPEDSDASGESPPSNQRNVDESSPREGTVLETLGSKNGEDLLAKMETASPTDDLDEAVANARGNAPETDDRQLETGGHSDSETGRTVGASEDLGRAPGARSAEGGRSTGDRGEVRVDCPDCDENPRGPDDDPPNAPGIGDVIERYSGRIQQCYERALKRDAGLAGKIVISLRVTASGSPTALRATRDTVGGGVTKCVVGVFRQMSFPSVDSQSSKVDKTFVFEQAN